MRALWFFSLEKGQEDRGIYCCLEILHKRLQRRQRQVFLKYAQGQERGNLQKTDQEKV